uniref:Uncharacterized protein n=1 Tax=Anopheles arabiensis TaxID=7173 RepID=A0A182IG10_ANOAR
MVGTNGDGTHRHRHRHHHCLPSDGDKRKCRYCTLLGRIAGYAGYPDCFPSSILTWLLVRVQWTFQCTRCPVSCTAVWHTSKRPIAGCTLSIRLKLRASARCGLIHHRRPRLPTQSRKPTVGVPDGAACIAAFGCGSALVAERF